MKQGKASSTTSAPKSPTVVNKVSPAAVSQIGAVVGTRQAASRPLYTGRTIEAPMGKCTVHKKGSQNG